jgi:hypothetical protein
MLPLTGDVKLDAALRVLSIANQVSAKHGMHELAV